jgi:hypothetical protein
LGRPLRERRRLPLRRAARRLQLVPQPIPLALELIPLPLQPIPLALEVIPVAPQLLAVALDPLELLAQPLDLAGWVVRVAACHLPPRHDGKKAYLTPRIYNAVRRATLNEYATSSSGTLSIATP